MARALALAASWAPSRRHWAARYHFGGLSFAARSRRSRQALRRDDACPDAVLQIGATFDSTRAGTPAFVYCDSNARVAEANRPYGDVALLSAAELAAMVARESHVYARAAHVFTMSELVRASMVRDFGLAESKVTTVFAGANLDPAACRPRVFSHEQPPTVLFVGRHWEAKGGPDLLDAFVQVRSVHPNLRLVIAGCTPPVGDVPGVEILGHVDKRTRSGAERLLSLYREADLFCMPSRFDAFGIVFVEAMLHGVACIGSRHAAMPEIIAHGETGWVVPVGDVTMVRDYLLKAFADRPALARMGQAGRERALRLFTWEAVAECMHQVMRPLLACH
jgi:glycosyltransferase involved in cell wall biosynthesis